MKNSTTSQRTFQTIQKNRRGAITVLAAVMMVSMMGMVAFAIDYGYLLKSRASLQRAADAAVLAAVRDLVPAPDGTQDLAAVRATLRQYADANITEIANFTIVDADIEIGRYDPNTIYTNFTILNYGTFDTVRVTLRRDSQANSPVSLFFAPVLGIHESNVVATATAILPQATVLQVASPVLPFSIQEDTWDSRDPGDTWSVYGDGRLLDDLGVVIPGNWGTLDVGASNNSTADLSDQIINGLRQSDLDALYSEGRIPTNTELDGSQSWWANGDPGLSAGIKHAIRQTHGQIRMIPIYDSIQAGAGNNTEVRIVKWAVVTVVGSNWTGGASNFSVSVQKTFTYDGSLKPQYDLSNTIGIIDGAFTTPVLVQ